MLVLMAIHDIMKMKPLLPVVSPAVGDFQGYKTGETINDHDVALSYVLQHNPDVLPSYSGLPPDQQEAIKFCHCKMSYNMGWLVQGEAPPAALFRTFRQIVISGQASSSNINFYFLHWFADLAAAEPYPLEGCEKFVLKFPQQVLKRFVESFSVVQSLGVAKTETQVFEDYLLWRWEHHDPPLGPPPVGRGSIAKMRLIMMAQGDSKVVLEALDRLSSDDSNVLFSELAITGSNGQSFERDPLANTMLFNKGPAILIYYAPALMQKAGKQDPGIAMMTLAEVFRQARELWPASEEHVDNTVTVRIDVLKALDVSSILAPEPGFTFVLARTSGQDAAVQLTDMNQWKTIDWSCHRALQCGPTGQSRRSRKGISSP